MEYASIKSLPSRMVTRQRTAIKMKNSNKTTPLKTKKLHQKVILGQLMTRSKMRAKKMEGNKKKKLISRFKRQMLKMHRPTHRMK